MHKILEFILPIVAASGEAVIGIFILITVVVIGRGKILSSEKPVTIERKGQYRMNLAPGLNLAQPFIEAIANQFVVRADKNQNGSILRFEVRDQNIASSKQPFYVLEISSQNGYLCFEARPTHQESIHSNTTYNSQTIFNDIENSINAVAKLWGIGLHRIN
jgi:hypothetical protein